MNIIEKKGNDILDIIKQFKNEQKVKDSDFTYEIIQKPQRGFLGLFGNKKAIVRFKVDNLAQEISDYLREFALYAQVTIEKITIKRDDRFFYVELNEVSDPGLFIGKEGSFLLNLQYLLNLTFSTKLTEQRSIIFDIVGYRKRQKVNIIKKTQQLAQKAIKTQKPVTLEPMPPAHRKIVHQALKEFRGIKTMLLGDGVNKRIVINPVGGGNYEPHQKIHPKFNKTAQEE
ncbi:MAG: Jag N-terminal domain-containing protein [Candidatus Cloacimonetes bacterium]|nr:Jag N-terminal domain-containing protein [Candidatus Cloacimonadota bacterium]